MGALLRLFFCASCAALAQANAPVYQATGFKIGEVTPDSAIIWTRLTRQAERNPNDGPKVTIRYVDNEFNNARRRGAVEAVQYPAGVTVDDLRNGAPGAAGETRVRYRAVGGSGGQSPDGQSTGGQSSGGQSSDWQSTDWRPVDNQQDYTRHFQLKNLAPHTTYELIVQGRSVEGSDPTSELTGGFTTAPLPDQAAQVSFTVSSCQAFGDRDHRDGFKIYGAMLKLRPNFFVHTGDILYYDKLAKTQELARYHWQRMYSLPTNAAFHQQVASYFEKDDHDTLVDDCWPTRSTPYMHKLTFKQGQAIFREQTPMSEKTYRTFRWGRDLQIWLVEGRDFRSANNAPDGPEKTIWGEEQKQWFRRTLAESDATFRILLSPTPMVGPDRVNKKDNHANRSFQHEGNELRELLGKQKNLVVICGDRHWQYKSVDPKTGLREYCCGPASDQHAAGWKQEDYIEEYHRFLRVKGGFLSTTVLREQDVPTLVMRMHGVEGKVHFEDKIIAE